MNRDFKGIWIPKEIWLNKDLTIMERLFLVEIDSLDQENGCFASNGHFAEMFEISKGRCTQIIKSLEAKGFLKIEIQREGKMITKRVIRVVNKLNTLFNILNTPIKNIKYPYLENDEGNNTITNNTKERDSALDFLEINFPSQYEVFLMQNQKAIKDFEKFKLDFNDTVDQEEIKYTGPILFARLRKYARNWVQNQDRYNKQEEKEPIPIYRRKIS
jgi:hypothetical protein